MPSKAPENKVYFFGTGHSYIVGQEVFARAGGYAGFIPILENELGMNHAFKSTLIERTTEYADVLLELYPFKKGDVIVMTSNSGRNALLIELSLRLKEMGVSIIAITALEASKNNISRHKSGLRLFELADVVLDNRSVYGDASLSHNDEIKTGPTSTIMSCFISRHKSGLRLFELADVVLDNRSVYGDASLSHNDEIKTGPTSTIMSCFIVQLLVSAFVQLEVEKGGDVPVFRSSNIDGGDAYNEKLFERYR